MGFRSRRRLAKKEEENAPPNTWFLRHRSKVMLVACLLFCTGWILSLFSNTWLPVTGATLFAGCLLLAFLDSTATGRIQSTRRIIDRNTQPKQFKLYQAFLILMAILLVAGLMLRGFK